MDFQVDMIRQAKERIGGYIVETPLIRAHNLDSFLGCHVYLKPECMQVTGAFKIRGAMNSMLALSGDELRRLCDKYIEQFVKEELEDFREKSSRFIYLFNRLKKDVYQVVEDMAAELRRSDFEPLDFELDFSWCSRSFY